MADSLRTDGARAIDHAAHGDRDAKIEQLLLTGLDHYFCGRYEQAIDIWTRTLFFDRGHARARAYIERARTALAERQRQAEELLQQGAAALDRGCGDEARRLLDAAVENGAHSHDVHPLIERLSRHAAAGDSMPPTSPPQVRVQPGGMAAAAAAPRAHPAHRSGPWLSAAMLVLVLLAAYALATRTALDVGAVQGTQDPAAGATAAPAARQVELPVPRRGEMALGRARALQLRGRLHEALAALEMVRPTDPEKAESDRVRAEIQRQLLSMAGQP